MGMPKKRECPDHSDTATILRNEKKTQGTRFEQISHAAYPACTFAKTAVKTESVYCAVFTNKAINSSSAQIWASREKEQVEHGLLPFTFESAVSDAFVKSDQVKRDTKQLGSTAP